VALYFLDDVPKVSEVVMRLFEELIDPIVRTAKRDDARYPPGPEGENARGIIDPLPAEYSNGLWRSVSKIKLSIIGSIRVIGRCISLINQDTKRQKMISRGL
jgi:hypothetical protein